MISKLRSYIVVNLWMKIDQPDTRRLQKKYYDVTAAVNPSVIDPMVTQGAPPPPPGYIC